MYADNLNIKTQKDEAGLWTREIHPTIKRVLEYYQTHPTIETFELKGINVTEIKNNKRCGFPFFYCLIGKILPQEWLNGSFIIKKNLTGSHRYFGIYGLYGKKPNTRIKTEHMYKTSGKIKHFFYIKQTEQGYTLVFLPSPKEDRRLYNFPNL
jgi:hypothetical protein